MKKLLVTLVSVAVFCGSLSALAQTKKEVKKTSSKRSVAQIGNVGSLKALYQTENIDTFVKLVFKDNLGPALEGEVYPIKDIKKVNSALKQALTPNPCQEDAQGGLSENTGWSEGKNFNFEDFGHDSVKEKGVVRIFRYHACEIFFQPSVAIVRPPRSTQWYLIPQFMNEVQAAFTYGQNSTGATDIVILGYSMWSGGGQANEIIKLAIKDDKQSKNAVKIIKAKTVSTEE